jgi:predicted RNase H-like HicB family nuclease
MPSLPGVVTQARTQEELMSNLREAITGWLEVNDERAMAAKVPTANVKNQSLKLAFA